jgi:hypothetical protein
VKPSRNYWQNQNNQREFMSNLAQTVSDLRMDPSMISRHFIIQLGGETLLRKYKSVAKLWKAFFPDADIKGSKPYERRLKTQTFLTQLIKQLWKDHTIQSNFKHPDLKFKTSNCILCINTL